MTAVVSPAPVAKSRGLNPRAIAAAAAAAVLLMGISTASIEAMARGSSPRDSAMGAGGKRRRSWGHSGDAVGAMSSGAEPAPRRPGFAGAPLPCPAERIRQSPKLRLLAPTEGGGEVAREASR